eukprot:TRINITY_DN21191_c0_g3_i1.p1 TRINITY_DN21191_c0_g3~~TRINITY_DN21191_c0_g3_i1.p1  ORF type:complete len:900 (-),score=151.72 TRINITY_DN21191_c0_g3_i1:343-3042(-)
MPTKSMSPADHDLSKQVKPLLGLSSGASDDELDSERTSTESVVFNWLLTGDENEAMQILLRVATQRPELMRRVTTNTEIVSDVNKRERKDDNKQSDAAPVLPLDEPLPAAAEAPGSSSAAPVLQFASMMYFFSEDEGTVEVEIFRLGNKQERSEVNFRTAEASAKEHEVYVPTSGTLVFEPGVDRMKVPVQLLQNPAWAPTLEFRVELDAGSCKNAMLGKHGWFTLIKVEDIDGFPSRETDVTRIAAKQAQASGKLTHHTTYKGLQQVVQQMNSLTLLAAYFKLNFEDPVVKAGTLKILLKDVLLHVYDIMRLLISVYLVDYVLKHDHSADELLFVQDREGSLILISAFILVPNIVLHYLDWLTPSWRVAGVSRKILQSALIRRFLHYNEQSKVDLDVGNLIVAVTKDVPELVLMGYMNILTIASDLIKLVLVLGYQFGMPLLFGTSIRITGILPLVIFPVMLLLWAWCRWDSTMANLQRNNVCWVELVDNVYHVINHSRLICDYAKRTLSIKYLDQDIMKFNASDVERLQMQANNNYFPQWLGLAMTSLYTWFGGMAVLGGELGLGIFLADIAIFTKISNSWSVIYAAVIDTNLVLPGLQRVAILMNLATDLEVREKMVKHMVATTKAMEEAIVQQWSGEVTLDRLPIYMKDIIFDYNLKGPDGESCFRQVQVDVSGSFKVEQGQFVALVGPRGGGKSTLLRVLGGVSVSGVTNLTGFFIPSHLKVLHVCADPILFRGSLYNNLTMVHKVGEDNEDGEKSLERVKSICEAVRMPEEILALIDKEDSFSWDAILSQTQRAQVNLARAFIDNPDVLVIHKPALLFDDETSMVVLQQLKKFVTNRGLSEPFDTWSLRRPRTCIFSSSKRYGTKIADKIFLISPALGICEVKANDITEAMLS